MLTKIVGIFICVLLVFSQSSLSERVGDDKYDALETSTPPDEVSSACILTKAELNSLLQIVQSAIDSTSIQILEAILPNELLVAEKCDEVQEILFTVQSLKQLITSLADSSISDPRHKELRVASENLVKDIELMFDNVQQASLEATQVKVIDIQDNIEKLGTHLDFFNKRNQEIRDKIREVRIELCVSQIHKEEYVAAVKTFNEFQDDNMVDPVIERAYKREKIYNVLQFTHHMETIQQVTRGAEMSYQKMKANADLGSHFVLFLSYEIVETRKAQSSGTVNSRLTVLYQNLGVPVKNVLNSLGLMVREGRSTDFGNIVRAFKAPSNTLTNYIRNIIEVAYATNDASKVKNILNCIDILTTTQLIFLGHDELFTRMRLASHLSSNSAVFLIGYKIKKRLEFLNNNNDPGNAARTGYQNMKSSLPSSVRAVLWNTYCQIWNTYVGEYLYTPDNNHVYDGSRRFLLSWIPKYGLGSLADWRFETDNEGRSFQIASRNRNEFMFADNTLYEFWGNYDRRRTFTHRTAGYRPTASRWVLTPTSSGYMKIKNEYYGEYLYAANLTKDRDRRFILLWRPGYPTSESDWYIP